MGKKMIILVTVMLAFIAFISLQGKAGELSGAITIAGSTSVQPLAEELAEVFMKKPRRRFFCRDSSRLILHS